MLGCVAPVFGGAGATVRWRRKRGLPAGGRWKAVTGVMASESSPRFGRWRPSGCAVALEGFDDDHAATATGAWRAMVPRGTGGHARVIMLRQHRRHRRTPQLRLGDDAPSARPHDRAGPRDIT